VLDDRVYVAGGFGDPRGQMLDHFVVYDPVADAWTRLAPLPEARHHAALTPLGSRLILTGGGAEGFAPRTNTWAYDPATNAWTALAAMPAPRRAHAAAVVDGRLYVIGGVVEGATLRAPTWVYDPASGEWRDDLAEMPTFREHLAAVPVVDGLIAIGGRGTQSVDAVERYEPATDTWTSLPPLPEARGGLAAAVLGETIHVIGGEGVDPLKIFRDHDVFDLDAGVWSIAPPMERGRHGLGAAVVDRRLYAIGGGPNPDLSTTDRVDVFTPDPP
jgi:N-acetylneuraminic acid mutarotase